MSKTLGVDWPASAGDQEMSTLLVNSVTIQVKVAGEPTTATFLELSTSEHCCLKLKLKYYKIDKWNILIMIQF